MLMESWMNHPDLKNLDPIKLELLMNAYQQTSGKNGKDLAPILMALITGANQRGIRFSPDEISLILGLLKEGKTEAEQEQIDRTVQMVNTFLKKRK